MLEPLPDEVGVVLLVHLARIGPPSRTGGDGTPNRANATWLTVTSTARANTGSDRSAASVCRCRWMRCRASWNSTNFTPSSPMATKNAGLNSNAHTPSPVAVTAAVLIAVVAMWW